MKINKWTQVLLGVGMVTIPAVTHAEEQLSQLRTELTSTTISGYVDTTATWKFGEGNANMPGRVYDGADTQDGFNLNVVSITFAKPLDESEWSAGYTVQTLMGPGAVKRGTRSLASSPGGPSGDFAFNEAVVLLRVPIGNGIDFKVGQFGTFNGYEAYDTYKNPNWSRSYGFYIESSAHTGVAASYKFGESITVQGGIGNMAGFNNAVDAKYSPALSETEKAYLAMVTYTAPESFGALKGATLSVGYTGGAATPTSDWWQENYYAGLSLPTPISGLAVGLAFDYTSGIQYEDSYAESLAAYVSYQVTEKLKLNGRADWAKGYNGSGVAVPAYNGAFGYTSASDGRNELFSATVTADYALWKNVISRLEFRWDTSLTGDSPFGGDVATAPGTPLVGGDENAVSLTANFIYQF